jgi:uncharacterized membrane protein
MTFESWLPVIFAFGTAVAFAVSAFLVRLGVEQSRPIVALFVTLCVNVVVLWTIVLWAHDVRADVWGWRYFILAGVFAPGLGRLCNYIGIQRVGVNLSVPISNANPVVSVVLAVSLLDERLSLLSSVGVGLVITGGVLLSSVRSGETTSYSRRNLVFPALGALLYGAVQILRDVGLQLVPAPVVGAAVNMTTSLVLIIIYLSASERYQSLTIGSRELRYFVPAGIASSLGLASLYSALNVGNVVIVAPILNTGPLFTLCLTYLFVRDGEVFGKKVSVGTLTIVLGVSLLSLAR